MRSNRWRDFVAMRMRAAATRGTRSRLACEVLEDRDNPTTIYAVASAPGAAPLVTVFDAATNQQKFTITPFDAPIAGGLNLAVGDVNGDGTADVIVGAGAGGAPVVKIYSGIDGSDLGSFVAGDGDSRAGASVAAADFNADGIAELVVGAIQGGSPFVQVRTLAGVVLSTLTPAGGSGGVSVAAGDVNGDGTPDVITGAGPGVGPRVQAFSGTSTTVLLDVLAFESTFTGGVRVAAGDVNGDGYADVIAAAGQGGGPRVRVFSGISTLTSAAGRVGLADFFAYDSGLRSGAFATAFDATNDGTLDVVTTNGPGQASSPKAFNGITGSALTATLSGLTVSAAFDDTPPVATLTSGARQPTNVSPFLVILTFDEPVKGVTAAALTATGGTVSAFTATSTTQYTFSVTPAGQGTVTITVATGAGTDAAGNPNASTSLTRTFDNVPPTVTANNKTTNDTTPTLTGTVSDSTANVGVTVNGIVYPATVTGTTWSATVTTPLAQGTFPVAVLATDPAGNTATATATLVIDTNSPAVTITPTTAAPLVTNDTTPVITGTVTDSTATVSVTVGGQTFAATVTGTTWTATVPTALAAGTYTITATATDPAGNTGTATATNALVIDLTAPVVGITPTTAAPLVTNNTKPTITGTVDDSTATVSVTVGGQTFAALVTGTTWSATVPADLAAGTYTITAAATDAAGNVGNATATNALIIDLTAPVIGIDATTAAPIVTSNPKPTISGTVDDSTAAVSVTVGGQTFAALVTGTTWEATVPANLAAGTYTIAATATDPAGNVGNASVTDGLVVDLTAPVVGIDPSTATPQVTNNQTPVITGTIDDPTATVSVTVGGQTLSAVVTGTTWTATVINPLAAGTYTIQAAATDPAGNLGTATATNALVIDLTAPVVASDATSAAPVTVTTATPTLTGTVDDSTATVTVTVDGQTYTATVTGNTWSADVTTALADGTYAIDVTATDPAGNVGTDSQAGALIVNAT